MTRKKEVAKKDVVTQSEVYGAIENNGDMLWYVAQTASKCEDAFSRSVEEHLEVRGLQDQVGMVLIPRVKKLDANGKERILNSYPSYVFLLARMTPELVHCIKGASKIMGFIGDSSLKDSGIPKPISERDIEQVIVQLPASKDNELSGNPDGNLIIDNKSYTSEQIIKSVASLKNGLKGEVVECDIDKSEIVIKVVMFGKEQEVKANIDQIDFIS